MSEGTAWLYAAALGLLALQLAADTRLSQHQTAHDIIHDTLIEGITFQEWGDGGASAANGAALPSEALRLAPPELAFGRCALGAAHARTVLVTNTGNATLHLASVSGTTPDFHASFFDAKSLPPQSNTSFSVVFLPRREGALTAHLYIHTSLGVHKYSVSGEGETGAYRLSPWSVSLPHDATLSAPLNLHNPHERALQVEEVYSSAAWLGLELPTAADEAPRDLWTLPPHTTRPLVVLRIRAHRLPPPHHHQRPHTAYLRIKVNETAPPLVVCVEVTQEPAGLYAQPPCLDAGLRGTRDPPAALPLHLGNSGAAAARLHGAAAPPHCAGRSAPAPAADLILLALDLPAHADPRHAATLTLHWDRMAAAAGDADGPDGVWCGGELQVRAGSGRRLSVPYRARLLPGTLRLEPAALSLVTAKREDALRERVVRARNEFAHPLFISELRADAPLDVHFSRSEWKPRALAPGAECTLVRLRLRHYEAALAISGELTVVTNVSEYRLPVHVTSGRLNFEWDWPVPGAENTDGALDLGAVTTSATRRVSGRLRNPGSASLCVVALGADMDGAALQYLPCAAAATPSTREHHPDDPCWCIEGGESAPISLALVAAAREGPASGRVWVRTPYARTDAPLAMRAVRGKLRATVAPLDHCAPSAWCSAPVHVENSMDARMRLLSVMPHPPDPSLTFKAVNGEIGVGTTVIGELVFAPELATAGRPYTGLPLDTTDGAAWAARTRATIDGGQEARDALLADMALQRERRLLYAELTSHRHNFTLLLHTTEVVMVGVEGGARLRWPRLAARAVDAGLAAVGAALRFSVSVRNPSASHYLLLHPVFGPPLDQSDREDWAEQWEACLARGCRWAGEAFKAHGWNGAASEWLIDGDAEHNALPPLVVEPGGEVTLELEFAPGAAARLAALLYLRNNLTAVERVVVFGEGAFPSFKFGNRRAGSGAPLLFELGERQLRECARPSAALSVRRAFTARNTGAIPVQVAALAINGLPCEGYGFKVLNCAPFTLEPNATHKVDVSFTPDWTLSRVVRTLVLHTSLGAPLHYTLVGAVPAHRLPGCAAALPRPPWEPYLRNAAVSVMICLGLAVLVTGFLDADRVLRHAAAAAPPSAPPPTLRRPLDLRALNHHHWPSCMPRAMAAPVPVLVSPPPPPPPRDSSPLRCDRDRTKRRTPRRMHHEPPDVDRPPPVEPPPTPAPTPVLPPPDDDDSSSTGTDLSAADDRDKEQIIDDAVMTPPPERPRLDAVAPASQSAPPSRPRRELTTPTRRTEPRPVPDVAPVPRALSTLKYQPKKEKQPKKRPERPHAAPPRGDGPLSGEGMARASPPAAPLPPPGPAVRPAWGATFSEVVAASGGCPHTAGVPRRVDPPQHVRPLGPIGSNYQKRQPEEHVHAAAAPLPDNNSLFYFSGEAGVGVIGKPTPPALDAADFGVWDSSHPAHPAPLYAGSLGSGVWSRGRSEEQSVPSPPAPQWTPGWGGYRGVRPPPGFANHPPAHHPPQPPPVPVRAFDPFQSLSSIWAPGSLHHLRREPDH